MRCAFPPYACCSRVAAAHPAKVVPRCVASGREVGRSGYDDRIDAGDVRARGCCLNTRPET